MGEVSVQLTCEVLGEPVLGLWCERCLTSARSAVLMRVTINGMPHSLGVISACDRCDAEVED